MAGSSLTITKTIPSSFSELSAACIFQLMAHISAYYLEFINIFTVRRYASAAYMLWTCVRPSFRPKRSSSKTVSLSSCNQRHLVTFQRSPSGYTEYTSVGKVATFDKNSLYLRNGTGQGHCLYHMKCE